MTARSRLLTAGKANARTAAEASESTPAKTEKPFDISKVKIRQGTKEQGGEETFRAFYGAKRIGYLMLGLGMPKTKADYGLAPHERSVYKASVDPAFQRKGVATLLYNAATAYLKTKGEELVPSMGLTMHSVSDDAYKFWSNRAPQHPRVTSDARRFESQYAEKPITYNGEDWIIDHTAGPKGFMVRKVNGEGTSWIPAKPVHELYGAPGQPQGAPKTAADQIEMFPDAQPITETPKFKSWFAGSKIVDESGKPLLVFHGSSENFKEFRGSSIHFTDLQSNAMGYATGYMHTGNGHIYEAYLSIEKPIDLRKPGESQRVYEETDQWIDSDTVMDVDAMAELDFSGTGYDGVINLHESGGGARDGALEYIVFDSGQIWIAKNEAVGKKTAKTAAFLRIDEMRELGRQVMESPEFKAAIEQVAPGKTFTELNAEEMDRFNMITRKQAAKTAFISPRNAEVTVAIEEGQRPQVTIGLDLGIPNFTQFTIAFPTSGLKHAEVSVYSRQAFSALLEDVSAFMLSMKYDEEQIVEITALAQECFRQLAGKHATDSDMSDQDTSVRLYEGAFEIPESFVDETYAKVVTAAVVQRTPETRHLQLTLLDIKDPAGTPENVITFYRSQSTRTTPRAFSVDIHEALEPKVKTRPADWQARLLREQAS